MASATPTIIAAVVGIVALLIVILIPTSFSSVEYYEVSKLNSEVFFARKHLR